MTNHFSPTAPYKFEFLLLEGFSNMVLANALEPLRDVHMRSAIANLEWEVTTLRGETIQSSSRLTISPDRSFDPEMTNGILVVVAGYRVRAQAKKQLVAEIRQAARNAKRVLALDTAAWLLAEAGLLDGHSATIHWQELDAFAEAFPGVNVTTARFVRTGKIMTCGGASTALDLMLDLIQDMFGPAAAFDASNMFLFDPARQNASQRGAKHLIDRGSPKVLDALNVIAENVERPLTTFELADRVAISERSLNRAFSDALGMTPGKYYRLYRLQHARYLAQETRLSAEQIAMRCGFSGASSMGRSFLREFGKPVSAFRS
ncbi:transcriptional regulator [Ruegeria sp. ANG-S4]|uniref:GlxA family transcriptional regulator n=1 Tax=Ruegeria sp. ANG-S4 TaxID=1577904 RepID=UPI00057F707C|nr:GlxA family transcriptional regulator [Ruegeria sp. ANG-S4]KIC45727.1 transcriptional regulator [Ruegeria sp. ANG-S4]